ncbi:VWA domain-containing protein [Parasulfitobacter algicola]|uniref:VWA domain-containing protein n=1 Tax=Parasulfitobacter algicola TaxID=2614809 RepID=A0ABX2ITN2_9RHOB|nr:VWA domain-containing protein [Sulfitobacter algicola]NSX56268.1 VWA domain-containing protein [Sulfitobacter algicola]
MRLTLFFWIFLTLFISAVSAQETTDTDNDILFILDGSGSMWGRVNDVEKIVVAKNVMAGLIEELPEEIHTGLITYGHRTRGSCDDIELIAVPGTTARTDLLSALADVNPLGKTPIAGSLIRAGEALRETENAVSIVLVSDGIESCEGDPCATAALLREQGIDVTIHVVGFDVDAEAEEQLSCIAKAGGGEYYQASSADALSGALADVRTSIVEPAPEQVIQETVTIDPNVRLAEDVIGGVNVVAIVSGETLLRLAGTAAEQIPPGSYQFEFDNFLSPAIIIEKDEEYVISAAQFGLSIVQLDGTQIQNVRVFDNATNEELTYLSGTIPQQFPSGSYRFEFANFTSPPFLIEANQTYIISPSDFALAQIAMDGTQFTNVYIIDDATAERVTFLSGTSPKKIPPGTYRFKFATFTSPPFIVEGNGNYTISPSDYGVAQIAMDGTQLKNVYIIDTATGESLTYLGGTSPKLIPAGTYQFKFNHFTSPPFVVEENGIYTISPSDYGLATVRTTRAISGGLQLQQDGKRIGTIRGNSPIQIAPGVYTLVQKNVELDTVTIEPGETRVFELEP